MWESRKEGAPSLEFGMESVKLIINRNSWKFIEITMKIA